MQTLFDSNKAKYMIKAGIKYIIYYLHSEQSAKYVNSNRLFLAAGVNLIKTCECKFSIKINLLKIDDDSKHLVAK